MKISEALIEEHSKQQIIKIANFIDSSASRMQVLMQLYFDNNKPVAQRAAWVMSTVAFQHPDLIFPYLKKIIKHLHKEGLHDAVKRNGVKVLEVIDFPKSLNGVAADLCFKLLSNPAESIAVRVFSMTVLTKICRQEPGLKNELRLIIESSLPFSSTGYRSRAKKSLKELSAEL